MTSWYKIKSYTGNYFYRSISYTQCSFHMFALKTRSIYTYYEKKKCSLRKIVCDFSIST